MSEIQRYQPGTLSVRKLLESDSYSARVKQLLGDRAPQFCASVIQISQLTNLANCEPESVIAASMIAATLDLPINPNLAFAYIVPYGSQAQFQLGYKGYVQLAARSGQYKRLNVTMVYEGELLRYDRAKAEVIIDETKRKSDKIVGYMAYLELNSGFEHAEYWDRDTVEKHAARFSQAYKRKNGQSVVHQLRRNGDEDRAEVVAVALGAALGADANRRHDGSKHAPESGRRPGVYRHRQRRGGGSAEADSQEARRESRTNFPARRARGASPVSATPADTLAQRVTRLLLDAGVVYDDFTDYLTNQGPMRNAKDYPGYDDLPPSVFEVLAENGGAITDKVIKLYGKSV